MVGWWEGIDVTADLPWDFEIIDWVGIDWFAAHSGREDGVLSVVSALAWRLEGEGCDWLRAVEVATP